MNNKKRMRELQKGYFEDVVFEGTLKEFFKKAASQEKEEE